MKTLSHLKQNTRRFAGAVTVAGCSLLMAAPFLAAAENENEGFLQKVQDWQNDMSARFGDTWKKLRKEDPTSLVSASVDLREQEKSYMLRLDLPRRDLDKVQVSLNGDVLRIAVPESGNLGRYEQSVVLGGVQAGAEPVIERKKEDGVITVTVPKGSRGPTPLSLRNPQATPPLLAPSKWESDVLREMDDLQREMDQIFQSAFGKVPRSPELLKYFDEPGFGAFIDLKEEGVSYVVTAYLPERDAKNVKATVEGRILKIEASAEDTPSKPRDGSNVSVTRRAHYSQHLTLPGPVKAGEMTVDRKEGLLKITVPKES